MCRGLSLVVRDYEWISYCSEEVVHKCVLPRCRGWTASICGRGVWKQHKGCSVWAREVCRVGMWCALLSKFLIFGLYVRAARIGLAMFLNEFRDTCFA